MKHEFPITHITPLSDNVVATGSSAGRISFLPLPSGKEVHQEPGDHQTAIIALSANARAGMIVSSDERSFCVWDISSLEWIGCIDSADSARGVAITPDGTSAYLLEMGFFVSRFPLSLSEWTSRARAIVRHAHGSPDDRLCGKL